MKNIYVPALVPIGLLLFIFLLGITAFNLLNVLSGSFPTEVITFLKVPKAMILFVYFGSYILSITLAIVAGAIVSWITKKRKLDIHVTGTLIQYALMLIPAAMTANKSFYWYSQKSNDSGNLFLVAAILMYVGMFLYTCWSLFREVRLAISSCVELNIRPSSPTLLPGEKGARDSKSLSSGRGI
jgi:hypothetical protein